MTSRELIAQQTKEINDLINSGKKTSEIVDSGKYPMELVKNVKSQWLELQKQNEREKERKKQEAHMARKKDEAHKAFLRRMGQDPNGKIKLPEPIYGNEGQQGTTEPVKDETKPTEGESNV